jgi:hypothetical protein
LFDIALNICTGFEEAAASEVQYSSVRLRERERDRRRLDRDEREFTT